ncbi:MiaB/RimO family radical SAM methylthiotransferase [Patescibacteria group bacterium AH-259-L05]|nr:MiaB/RimO family radical SAM methylthiotransferase [Patescibacteria group bacterium AH-259-L05]
MKYFIKTFGCQQNTADSERIASYYQARGYTPANNYEDSDVVVINTCVVRQQAEDRVYGLAQNLQPLKDKNPDFKIVVTGCLVGAAAREPTGKLVRQMKRRLPNVDEFLPIEEVGFEYQAIRDDKEHGWVPISSGCNNFCTFCIVPFSRGREISRPFQEIIDEVKHLVQVGYSKLTLLGQNVNSYGSDLVKRHEDKQVKYYELPDGRKVKPVIVKHLGRYRIPTLFPYLLETIAKIKQFKKISFISSNPWDFSDELIEVISKYKNIDRILHLPVQAGDNKVLKRMNRWYTREQYMDLVKKIRGKVRGVSFTTDIIVGFPGETDKAFQNTIDLSRRIKFERAFIACYSPRPGTVAAQSPQFKDDVPYEIKKQRFHTLDKFINYKYRKDN